MVVIASIGTFLSFFLLLVLLANRPTMAADLWLGMWLCLQILLCGGPIASEFLSHRLALFVLAASQLSLFCLGPAQYLYAATALQAPRRFGWHAITIGWAAAALVGILLLVRPRPFGGALVTDDPPAWLILVPLSAVAITPLHPLAVLRLARRRRALLADRLSNLDEADPEWLCTWAWATLATIALLGSTILGSLLLGWGAAAQMILILGLQVASIVYVGQRGLTRHRIFFATADQAPKRDQKPTIDPAEAQADYSRVQTLLETEKPHLDSGLTAQMVADRLGWAPERLTRALKGGDVNFFCAINAARVLEVQRAMADPRNSKTSILALGHDAGFGSKTALYDAFRRSAGCSPAEWRSRKQAS
jgi:AraC-like DNA-binding protein